MVLPPNNQTETFTTEQELHARLNELRDQYNSVAYRALHKFGLSIRPTTMTYSVMGVASTEIMDGFEVSRIVR